MTTHLSYPESCGVYQLIDPNLCTVQHSSFDSVVDMIAKLGEGTLLGKVDVNRVFRIIFVGEMDAGN